MRSLPTVIAMIPAVFVLAYAAGAAWAQEEEGSTPGAIPDPGSYQGSMQLQQQSDQQDQQFRQQQQADQPTYTQPSYGSPGSGGDSAPRQSSSGRLSTPRNPPPAAAQAALLRF